MLFTMKFDHKWTLSYSFILNTIISIPNTTEYDTSCFSGKYVTGETIGNAYFTRLHELRNDSAQALRRLPSSGVQSQNGTAERMAKGSNHGCESMSNDQSAGAINDKAGCESINNE